MRSLAHTGGGSDLSGSECFSACKGPGLGKEEGSRVGGMKVF